jgi:hypothetical protein
VQLADDRDEVFKFQSSDDIESLSADFIARIKLNAMFKDPLKEKANSMIAADQRTERVDVVDLL